MHQLLLLLLAFFLLRSAAPSAAQSSSCWPMACGGLSILFLLLASFLLRPAAAGAEQPAAQSSTSSCWPKACGDLSITYPFWVEEPGRPPCGPPAFNLKCNSSGAFLSSSIYQAYRVESIFPKNRSLHVVDINLPLATGCPAPISNVSFIARPLFFSKANRELLFLGKCTESQPEPSAGFHSLPCDSSSFVRLADGRNFSSSHVQGGIPPSCFFAFAPVLVPPRTKEELLLEQWRSLIFIFRKMRGASPLLQ